MDCVGCKQEINSNNNTTTTSGDKVCMFCYKQSTALYKCGTLNTIEITTAMEQLLEYNKIVTKYLTQIVRLSKDKNLALSALLEQYIAYEEELALSMYQKTRECLSVQEHHRMVHALVGEFQLTTRQRSWNDCGLDHKMLMTLKDIYLDHTAGKEFLL